MARQSTEARLADLQGEGRSVSAGMKALLEWQRVPCRFPVEGAAGWQNFLAQPSEVQTQHYQPQIHCMMAVLDRAMKNDDDADPLSDPLPTLPIVCVACKDGWQCRCAHNETHRLCTDTWLCNSRHWDCKTQKEIPRSRSPSPPPPSMVKIQQLHFSGNLEKKIRKAETDPHRVPPVKCAKHRLADGSRTHSISVRAADSQTDWESVRALLHPKVLKLERTRPEVTWALEDLCTTICLCKHTDYQGHLADVVLSLPKEMRFKVGITVNLRNRFYEARYAYSTPGAAHLDGIAYEGWILVYVHWNREVVSHVEHGAIKLFKHGQKGIDTTRCANRKEDCDNHFVFDSQSDEEKPSAPGPHWVYIAWGPWCYSTRDE